MSFEILTRENLADYCIGYIYQGSGTRADVKLVQIQGKKAAVKDYYHRDILFKLILGKWLSAREFKIYQRLSNVKGIPQVYKKIDSYAFVYEYIEGKNCRDLQGKQLSKDVFDKLRDLIDRIHEHKVVHCDLKTNKNIILTPEDEPYLVDFTASFTPGNRLNFIKNWFFKQFCQDDLNGISKLKKEFAPHLLTLEEERNLTNRIFLEKQVRYCRDVVRKWIQTLLTKK